MIISPDFIDHPWMPLTHVERDGDFVQVAWDDGLQYRAYVLWLAENSPGLGLDEQTRESTFNPSRYANISLINCSLGEQGSLTLRWCTEMALSEPGGENSSAQRTEECHLHPGWLRCVAEGGYHPFAPLPAEQSWTADDLEQPPTVLGDVSDKRNLEAWLTNLVKYGVGRLQDVGVSDSLLAQIIAAVGPIRSSNFGEMFTVNVKPSPDSLAYSGIALGQHTDLPTRETPPGFQFLHCVENTVTGGQGRLTDGLAVVEALRREEPEVLDSLLQDEWVFINRAEDAEHRYQAPIVELPNGGKPLTIRAFYPVRSLPAMPEHRVAFAYQALAMFQRYAEDDRYCMSFTYQAGDLLGFDNRRILHGRTAFSSTGSRTLVGCYVDRDDVLSQLRVLKRPGS